MLSCWLPRSLGDRGREVIKLLAAGQYTYGTCSERCGSARSPAPERRRRRKMARRRRRRRVVRRRRRMARRRMAAGGSGAAPQHHAPALLADFQNLKKSGRGANCSWVLK